MTPTSIKTDSLPPLVSIYCTVFNHEYFLPACLEGFAMQKTNFGLEVLIHDDASTDKSANIIREYIKKYPHIQWRPIFQTENQYSQGKSISQICLKNVRGKYVAFCEGDDYWTDPNKLQKQVDFLESHHDFSMCFHRVRETWEKGEFPDHIFPSKKMLKKRTELTLRDFLEQNFIQTCSVMYRWCFNRTDFKLEDHFPQNILPGDYMFHLFHAKLGRVKLLDGVMGVYRRQASGVWFEAAKTDRFYIQNCLKLLNFEQHKNRLFSPEPQSNESEYMHDIIMACIVEKKWDLLQQVEAFSPKQFANSTLALSKSKRLTLRDRYIQGIEQELTQKGMFYKICKLLFKCYTLPKRLFKNSVKPS